MAPTFSLLLILHYFCVSLSAQELSVAESTLQNVENVLNSNNESEWMYSNPVVTTIHISFENETAEFSVEQLELRVKECQKEDDSQCAERQVVCAVVNKGNISEVISCAPKEKHHHIINDLGYKEESVADVENIVRSAFERSSINVSKRIVDIISVKKQETQNDTELYATVKVTNAVEGDALQLEVCEFEIVSPQQSEAVARDGNCFPLTETQTQYSGSEDEMPKIAQEAVEHLNGLSQSKFAYNLHDIIRAEKTVTPGSQGTLVNLQLKVVPSLCLKLLSFTINKKCPENEDMTCMACNLTRWNRPWKGDVIYSSPECRVDVEKIAALQSFDVGSRSDGPKVVDDSEIEKYLESIIEVDVPEPEESAGKMSDSKPEELSTIGSTIALDTGDSNPAVEEPIIAKKSFCLGCPVDLNLNRPEMNELLDMALDSIDQSATNIYKHALVHIHRAQMQVVNGINYMLLLDVGETECLKEAPHHRDMCEFKPKSDPDICYIEIFETPGLQRHKEVTFNNCSNIDDNYRSNEIVANPPSVSISKNENAPTRRDNDKSPDGSLGDVAAVSADDIMDYLEGIPSEGEDMGDSTPDSEVYYQVEQSTRTKRRGTSGFVGGLKDIGPGEEQLVSDLAATAVETLDAIDEDSLKRVVVEVVDAKKQIMDGVMYHLKLVIGTSMCDEINEPIGDCLTDLVTPLSLCTVHLHRSFVDNSLRVQVVKSECAPKEEERSADTFQPRTIDGDSSTTSGSGVDSYYNPRISRATDFALSEINKNLNVPHKFLDVFNIHTEVQGNISIYLTLKIAPCVDGNKSVDNCKPQITEAKFCKAEVSEAVPEKSMKLLNFSCTNSSIEEQQEINGHPGAPAPLNVRDPYVQELADSSLAELNRMSNSLYRHELIRILSADVQIQGSGLFHLRIEVGHSSCKKENENDSGDCSVRKDLGNEICDVKLWDRPSLKDRSVEKISCSPASIQRRKRSAEPHRMLVGAPGNIDVNNSGVKDVTSFAVAELDRQSNSQFKRKPVKILDAKTQVVAGILYHLTVETGETTCPKEAAGSAEECDLKQDSENHICKLKVLVQAWADHRELTASQCSVKPQARKRRAIMQMDMPNPLIRGGSVKADVVDKATKDVASYALDAIDRESNSAKKKKILRILRVKSQIVEGLIMYHLDLEVADTGCLKGDKQPDEECKLSENMETQVCHVEVFETLWVKTRKITKLICTSKQRKKLQSPVQFQVGKNDAHLKLFTDFMSKYEKTYNSDEEMQKRFHIFKANMVKIEDLQRTEQGTGKYGVTQFADLSEKEFKQKYLGLNRALRRENEVPMANAKIPDVELPVEFDWRHHNVVTPVKNQGMCGSCWAFSVTGNVEGQWAIRKGQLLSLSEQELVDCDTLDNGCEGGLPDNAYRAIEKLGGLETENDYPYDGEDEKCHFNRSEVRVTIQGAVNISSNETKMAQWLVKNGPISIGINANAMQFYLGGVSHPWKFLCDPDNLDHGVLIVGYGVHKYPLFKKTLPFWIIKNSWGESWGEQGYYRVYRGDGTCGVNMMASSAIVA